MKRLVFYVCLTMLLAACQTAPAAQPTSLPAPASAVLPASTALPTFTPILPTATFVPTLEPAASLRLTLAQLQNAAYHSATWGDHQLVDGVFYRTPPVVGESPQLYSTQLTMPTFGDLDGDGFQDAVVLLVSYNGGNGNSKELTAVLDQDGQPVNVSTALVGSLVGVDDIQIQGGGVTLQVRTLGPSDPLCCPSQQETWRFRLDNGQLARLP